MLLQRISGILSRCCLSILYYIIYTNNAKEVLPRRCIVMEIRVFSKISKICSRIRTHIVRLSTYNSILQI